MLLIALNAIKWIQANWKLVAVIAILAASFASGWYVRGYIAGAAQNKAIAEAVAETKEKEKTLYEKALQQERRKRAIRERARASNVAINSAAGDECSDRIIPTEWLRIIQNALNNGTGESR